MAKFITDPEEFKNLDLVADIETIRKYVPQRHEFEMLSGIVRVDTGQKICVGFQDVPQEPFWARGHIPGRPIMPGVLMVEAAAQLCTYYYKSTVDDARFLGFGGIEGVKFRGTVQPGDRLYIVTRNVELRSRRMVFESQAFLNNRLVYEGTIIGMPV
jgi:3-hydroxyacyl-[acyl-carrier-protein] dehydratase